MDSTYCVHTQRVNPTPASVGTTELRNIRSVGSPSGGKRDAGSTAVHHVDRPQQPYALTKQVKIQPKHLRWLSELLADGSTLRSLSGRSARLADGLSRNPPERDELLQQRTKDLQGLIGQLRGFSLEEFLGEEETGKVIPWSLLSDVEAAVEPVDLMTGKKVRPGSLARSDQDPGAGGRWSQCRPTRSVVFRESWLSQGQCLS